MRWCKEHKDLDRFGPPERNTLRPVWWFVFPLALSNVFGGVPVRPYVIWGNRVTWEVLVVFCLGPSPRSSASFHVNRLVLLLFR